MFRHPQAFARVGLIVCSGVLASCGPHDLQGYEIIAPDFEPSHARLARNPYAPVGLFADQRGEVVPFIDGNGDGKLDPQTEASGRCDQRGHRCWINRARLRLISTSTDCEASAGTWLLGTLYDHDGHQLSAILCDDHGLCSEDHADAFQGVDNVHAIWLPAAAESAAPRTLSLRAGSEEHRFADVALPAPLHVLDVKVSQVSDLQVRVSADQTIDMASLLVKRGEDLQWSSADRPDTFHAIGPLLEASIPRAVLDACAGMCEAYLQVAHVSRDDDVFTMAEYRQRVL